MAREVIEKLIDDLDGSGAVETVTFALDGTSYEIDLSKRNAAALRKSLDRYVAAARRQGPPAAARRRPAKQAGKAARSTPTGKKPKPKPKPKRGFDLVQLREWAGANGVDVPSRGRIPQAVVAQYKAAGGR